MMERIRFPSSKIEDFEYKVANHTKRNKKTKQKNPNSKLQNEQKTRSKLQNPKAKKCSRVLRPLPPRRAVGRRVLHPRKKSEIQDVVNLKMGIEEVNM